MARTARGDLGHGMARETMSRMPVVQIRRRIRTPRGISTDPCCCLQPLVLSAVRPSVCYRCLLVPHSVTQLLEQRWTCSSKHALTGCLLSLHLRMSLALGGLMDVMAIMGTTSGEYSASFLFSFPAYVKSDRLTATIANAEMSSLSWDGFFGCSNALQ